MDRSRTCLVVRFVLVIASVDRFVATAAAAPAATSPTCWLGFEATIVGTAHADVIEGTRGDDVIVGLGGDDRIDGLGGNDVICGNAGDDVLVSGPGDAALKGDSGNDVLRAGDGFADLLPGEGDDRVVGRADAPNWIHYSDARGPIYLNLTTGVARGEGHDVLVHVHGGQTGPYADTLIGTDRGDGLKGAAGDDVIRGLGSSDFLAGQGGDDRIEGGPGFDIADYFDGNYDDGLSTAGPISVDLATGVATGDGSDVLVDIEGATGRTGADTMIGDDGDNAFFQLWEGGDTILAGGGDDYLFPGSGADAIDGGPGTDFLSMADGELDAPRTDGVEVDLAAGSSSDGDAIAGVEQVGGTTFADRLSGSAGADALFGTDGDDTLDGGAGDDIVDGGNGTDVLAGGTGGDLLAFQDHWSGGVEADLATGSDSDGDGLSGFEDVLGTTESDRIAGDAANNHLYGGGGGDVLSGAEGDDVLVGDGGFDVARGGPDADRCDAESIRACEYGWYRVPARASLEAISRMVRMIRAWTAITGIER
jgi:Ca2+-binding RTX toxin-like protein